jgi:hypothetical protein
MTRTAFVRWLQTMFAVELHDDASHARLWDGVVLGHANPDLVEQLVKPNLPSGSRLFGAKCEAVVYFDWEHEQPGDHWWLEIPEGEDY